VRERLVEKPEDPRAIDGVAHPASSFAVNYAQLFPRQAAQRSRFIVAAERRPRLRDPSNRRIRLRITLRTCFWIT